MKFFSTLLAICCLSVSLPTLSQTVKITTNLGSFEISLYENKAPQTVANFLRYVEDGSYEGTLFHRVIPNFMVQGGGYNADYQQVATYKAIPNESKNGHSNQRATIAMARSSHPDSATRQFFINVVDNQYLDGNPSKYGYTVFGEVSRGMEIIDRIALQATQTGPVPGMKNVPKQKIIIQDVALVIDPEFEALKAELDMF